MCISLKKQICIGSILIKLETFERLDFIQLDLHLLHFCFCVGNEVILMLKLFLRRFNLSISCSDSIRPIHNSFW